MCWLGWMSPIIRAVAFQVRTGDRSNVEEGGREVGITLGELVLSLVVLALLAALVVLGIDGWRLRD